MNRSTVAGIAVIISFSDSRHDRQSQAATGRGTVAPPHDQERKTS
jgi:hypothetical protein